MSPRAGPKSRKLSPPLPRDFPLRQRVQRIIVRLVQGLYFHDALVAAPAMAFHFFLSLVPLLVFLGWVVGSLVRAKGAAAVLAPFFENVPHASLGVIETELERLAGAGAPMAPIAVLGFLWLASGGVHGAMDTLEVVVGAPRRPWWKKRVLATAWVIGSLLVVTLGSWGVFAFDRVMYGDHSASASASVNAAPIRSANANAAPSASANANAAPSASANASPVAAASAPPPEPDKQVTPARPHDLRSVAARAKSFRRRSLRLLRSTGQRLLALLFSAALTAAALAAFYRFAVAHPREVRRRVWPGAALAVALWLVVSWAFGAYVRSLAEYAVFYGSLAAVAVLLIWFWLTSLAILVGAELNAQLEGMRE